MRFKGGLKMPKSASAGITEIEQLPNESGLPVRILEAKGGDTGIADLGYTESQWHSIRVLARSSLNRI
jgi:hypothetical protein